MQLPNTPSLYIQAAHQRNMSGKVPIWMMRQAGRYMPEYRDIRARNSFLDMVKTPEIAAKITLQPIEKFGMDAAILFSDILVTAEALGSHLQFVEKVGPLIENPSRTNDDVHALSTSDIPTKLAYVFEAIRHVKPSLKNTPLIGFAGAPFTVASYMIEGKSSSDLSTVKKLMFTQPEVVHALLEKLTGVTIDYLNGQIEAGVDALQLFDTWAMHLSWEAFQTFSLNYIQRILSQLHNPRHIPVTIFCKGSSVFAPLIAQTGCQVVSLDWQCSLKNMRTILPNSVAIQGNLDPHYLYASDAILKTEVYRILEEMRGHSGYIFNLGHGLMPDMNPDQVKKVVDWVQSYD